MFILLLSILAIQSVKGPQHGPARLTSLRVHKQHPSSKHKPRFKAMDNAPAKPREIDHHLQNELVDLIDMSRLNLPLPCLAAKLETKALSRLGNRDVSK